MALDFLAGCVGGAAGIIAGHPLDTLKVHVQAGRGGGVAACTRELMRGGVRAAYRGVRAPLAGVAGVNALVFGAYGHTRRALPEPDALWTHATAGATAGALQSIACAPVELVKTRQQLGQAIPTTTTAAVRHVMRSGGLRGLYRGLSVTVVRDAPGLAVYFAAYEALVRGGGAGSERSMTRVFLAGGAAGALSWIVSYPADVIKSRVQADHAGRWASARACLTEAIRVDGPRVLVRGLGAVLARAFLANGACFTAVWWTERAWHALLNSPLPDIAHELPTALPVELQERI